MAQSTDSAAQELLRQQERERALRDQQDTTPDVRLQRPAQVAPDRLPSDENPVLPHHGTLAGSNGH